MSVFVLEGENRFYLGAQAILLDNARETASEWAASHIITNPAHSWVLGKFVEADRANLNKQYFSLEGLLMGRPSITHAPMNINHSARNIVGSFVATEMVYPAGEQADDTPENPYIESLGVFWRYYFPDEYTQVARAHGEGSLFYSMEAVPTSISTIGGTDDSTVYPYEGRVSPNYPDEINKRTVDAIVLHEPHFTGGALILPPEKPGWRGADITQVSKLMNSRWKEAEMAYESIKDAAPHLDPAAWESIMHELLFMAYEHEEGRNFSADKRKSLAKTGAAMKDGSFPIENVSDLKNAIRLAGKAKNPSSARSHIKKRAKALGQSKLIPEDW